MANFNFLSLCLTRISICLMRLLPLSTLQWYNRVVSLRPKDQFSESASRIKQLKMPDLALARRGRRFRRRRIRFLLRILMAILSFGIRIILKIRRRISPNTHNPSKMSILSQKMASFIWFLAVGTVWSNSGRYKVTRLVFSCKLLARHLLGSLYIK